MVRAVWAQMQEDRRLYLVDATSTFIAPVKTFLDAYAALGKSPNTLESYCYRLKPYFTYLDDQQQDWQSATADTLISFVEWLRLPPRQLGACSINTTLAALASFYRYHALRSHVPANPFMYELASSRFRRYKPFLVHTQRGRMTTRDPKVREPHRPPGALSDADFARFYEAIPHRQFRCILLLMRDGGLRSGEVLGLQIPDIAFHRNGIRIRRREGLANGALAKGLAEHEERFVELTPAVMALLDALVLQHTFATDHVFVVQSKQARNRQGVATYGTPLTRDALKACFRYYSQKTGIAVHAHLLRHTHATELVRAGWDASFVQQRLGHASVQTTLNTYVHLDDADLSRRWQAYQERKQQLDVTD